MGLQYPRSPGRCSAARSTLKTIRGQTPRACTRSQRRRPPREHATSTHCPPRSAPAVHNGRQQREALLRAHQHRLKAQVHGTHAEAAGLASWCFHPRPCRPAPPATSLDPSQMPASARSPARPSPLMNPPAAARRRPCSPARTRTHAHTKQQCVGRGAAAGRTNFYWYTSTEARSASAMRESESASGVCEWSVRVECEVRASTCWCSHSSEGHFILYT